MDGYPEFDKHFEILCKQAEEVFLRDGHHVEILSLTGKNGKTSIVGISVETPEQRDMLYKNVGRILRGQIEFYFHISEAWALSTTSLDDLLGELRPSLNPKREEWLMVYGSDGKENLRVRSWKILRTKESGKEVLHLGPPIDGKAPRSRWDEELFGIAFDGVGKIKNDRFTI